MTANRTVPSVDAYDRWAVSYPPWPHNPLMRAEQKAMLEQWPEVAGRRALDLACGSGRCAKLLAKVAQARCSQWISPRQCCGRSRPGTGFAPT